MKRTIAVLALAVVVAAAAVPGGQAPPQIRHISPELQKAVAATDYAAVRIKKFPFASEAWTFRKFTFVETLWPSSRSSVSPRSKPSPARPWQPSSPGPASTRT